MKPLYAILILVLISHNCLSQQGNFQVGSKINDTISIITHNNQYGLISSYGKILLQPVYKQIKPIPNSEYLHVVDTTQKAGYNFLYDMELLKLHPYPILKLPLYEFRKSRSNYILVGNIDTLQKAVKYGYMDHNGNLRIPFEYDRASAFKEQRAIVGKGGKFGIINLDNEVIVPLKYKLIFKYENGFAKVWNSKDKYGMVDRNGALIIPEVYKSISYFHLDKAIVSTKEGYGVIDNKNNFIIEPQYTFITESNRSSESSLFMVQKGDKWGVLDRNGQVIVPLEHEEDMGFYLSLIRLTKQGMDGVYDRAGKIVIPFEFDKIRILPLRYIAVYKDGKVGIYNNNGTEVIPIEYDEWKRNSWDQFKMIRNGEVTIFNL